jgi:peptide/nickel transport system substrate-binding protein
MGVSLTWTFTLRPGLQFQDDTNLDGAAVLFNFNRWWDPANPYQVGNFFYFDYSFSFKGPDSLISALAVNSSGQFVITLTRPAAILGILAMTPFSIASPTALQAGTLASQPVGSGPFLLSERIVGDHITLVRNDGYAGKPAIPPVVNFVITPAANQLSALQANSIQAAWDISGGNLATALSDPTLKVDFQPAKMLGYLGINRAKPLSSPQPLPTSV